MEPSEVSIEDEVLKKFCQQNFSYKEKPLVMIKPYDQMLRAGYNTFHERIQNFEVDNTDVWITTFPKSGTRWMQEIVWCLTNGLDYEKAKSQVLEERVPFFDFDLVSPINSTGSFDKVDALKKPRVIKTHLSYDMLPKQLKDKNVKIINVYRNPRDACVSYLNHQRQVENYTGDLETLVDLFVRDIGPLYTPYFKHIFSYWNKRETHPNLFVVSYEEMQANLQEVIKRLAKFLDVTVSVDEIVQLCEHVSFKQMKANPMLNREEVFKKLKKMMQNNQEGSILNKGKSGTWKEHLTEDMVKRFEEWEAKWMKDNDLKFVYSV